MGFIDWIKKRRLKKKLEKLEPENCWHNEGYFICSAGAESFVCANCGALVNNTPFGRKVVYKDAREYLRRVWGYKNPEKYFDVKKWKNEELKK